MSKYPDKARFWRRKGFEVIEKRGWTRKIRSEAKKRLSQQEYVTCMKQVGWESII
ncbi:hypothetical protein M3641_27405 [Bacillus cereus]|uniref:hypothetical protein n=1 Tax=Bacillus cereus group TaxID=86661 RepID=UPI0012FE74F9|nr:MULTISPECIES: hypothetical protein [Bacillus cereus group]MCC2375817.1 hypothetical protein [Bacillus paranthracis]MCM3330386.1 hypothetical protein [Bacillus cereus]MDA2738858.1 hypothetical protein [Bacillus cereus group sp. Bc015]MEB9429931.1 hypothetical protein [Bacillus cereus]MEB9458748.1 hypothetical protein [Bacillus anthracis]